MRPSVPRPLACVLGALFTLGMGGCDKEATAPLASFDCPGGTLRLEKHSRTTFETVYHSLSLVYADRPPIVLGNDALGRGLPYDDGVYRGAPFRRFATATGPLPTVLYVPPQTFERAAFDALAACLDVHSAEAMEAVRAAADLSPMRFVGAVLGDHDSFVERFASDAGHVYEIDPQGKITYIEKTGGMTVTSLSVLARVVMPGRRIVVDASLANTSIPVPTRSELARFRNAAGETLTERFAIDPLPGETR